VQKLVDDLADWLMDGRHRASSGAGQSVSVQGSGWSLEGGEPVTQRIDLIEE
jgi:hypothetical protein